MFDRNTMYQIIKCHQPDILINVSIKDKFDVKLAKFALYPYNFLQGTSYIYLGYILYFILVLLMPTH